MHYTPGVGAVSPHYRVAVAAGSRPRAPRAGRPFLEFDQNEKLNFWTQKVFSKRSLVCCLFDSGKPQLYPNCGNYDEEDPAGWPTCQVQTFSLLWKRTVDKQNNTANGVDNYKLWRVLLVEQLTLNTGTRPQGMVASPSITQPHFADAVHISTNQLATSVPLILRFADWPCLRRGWQR